MLIFLSAGLIFGGVNRLCPIHPICVTPSTAPVGLLPSSGDTFIDSDVLDLILNSIWPAQ